MATSPSPSPSPHAALRDRLPGLMLRDRRRLARRLDGARKVGDADRRQAILDEIAADVDTAQQRVERRHATVPRIDYPQALPISARRDDIAAAIRDNQVVVVAGETGSGKTTQLPKICLELGRGVTALIGHTQPRRLAARTVAERIAEETDTSLGDAVGYSVRFTDRVGDDTLVKLMTDGILLAEIQRDRLLRRYDTLIIDEAHERSLNIDFIIGYLKQLLPRRPDLKVIITSATIDPERFSRHFDGAPVIEVSGRTYPVEVRYRPLVDEEPDDAAVVRDRDQTQAICEAVRELCAEGLRTGGTGDILVFLSGEREIRDTRDALTALDLPDTEVLPLFARLSAADQHRVFAPHRGRRIVLATNVAETSLTVPGIKYVVDPGTARISRYSHRLKVQRLPIEPISKASANQRKGRCGRTSEGICIRLYSEADFEARPEFTDPEILRTNLASVILQMTSLRLGDVAAFPFVDPPDRRAISDGLALLHELGALDPSQRDQRKQPTRQRLTPLGRDLAQLPVDPRLGRMVLEGDRNGCLREVMIVVAALSIQDPRERPAEAQQAADDKHARFADKDSDFQAYLNLWHYLGEQQKALSSNRFRRLCRDEFLHYLRVREWQDLYGQLRQVASGLRLTRNSTPADSQRIHLSLLAGLLSHIGLRDPERRDYLGARGARFAVFPGSGLFRKPPRWVMAAELVETSRLWGRICARIEPEWIEPLAQHLVKRSYSEPHWERNRGSAVATERVTLYGIPIVAGRKVGYGSIDPEVSRELFIRHALVEGDWDTRHEFFHDNRALLADVEELENRARRRDILIDDDTLFDFYDRRIPAHVVSAKHFDSWWRKARRRDPELLSFPTGMLVNEGAAGVAQRDYPDVWRHGSLRLPLTYQFEPGTAADGVTVHIPLAVLNQVSADEFSWQVPGLREELVVALLKSLPKQLRRAVVPVPDHARAVLARLTPYDGPLPDAVAWQLEELAGVSVPPDAWQLDRVPEHLKMTFRVVEGSDRTVDEGKDLDELKQRCAPALQASLSDAAGELEHSGLRSWSVGTLPATHRERRDGHVVLGHPALVDEGDSVAVRMFDSPEAQRREMWRGTRRLLLLEVGSPVKQVARALGNEAKLTLTRNPHGSVAALLDDCVHCAADAIIAEAGGPAWDEAGFGRLRDALRARLAATTADVVERARRVLVVAHAVEGRLAAAVGPADSLADVRSQFDALVGPGFVTATGYSRLADLPRYLQAIERRLDKLPRDPDGDRERMQRISAVTAEYEQLRSSMPDGEAVRGIRWMIEELRVSYFAQELKTAYPVSDKRIYRAIDDVAASV